jgi:hypothetical protein
MAETPVGAARDVLLKRQNEVLSKVDLGPGYGSDRRRSTGGAPTTSRCAPTPPAEGAPASASWTRWTRRRRKRDQASELALAVQ